MIDVNLPLELEDGTPVTYLRPGSTPGTIVVEVPTRPYGEKHNQTIRIFRLNDGSHYWNELPRLRNKKLEDISSFTDKQLATEIRAVDDRYHSLLRELNKRGFTVFAEDDLELVEARVGKISKEEIL